MREENNLKRRNVLEMMASGFDAQGTGAVVINKGVDGAECDILSVIHDDIEGLNDSVRGRYYFPEFEIAADNVQYFTCAIELSDELTKKDSNAYAKICNEINPTLVCGSFVIYPEVGLVYNLTVPLIERLTEDELFEQVNITIGNALAMVGAFVDKFKA